MFLQTKKEISLDFSVPCDSVKCNTKSQQLVVYLSASCCSHTVSTKFILRVQEQLSNLFHKKVYLSKAFISTESVAAFSVLYLPTHNKLHVLDHECCGCLHIMRSEGRHEREDREFNTVSSILKKNLQICKQFIYFTSR